MPDLTDLLRSLPPDVQRKVGNAALDATDASVQRIVPSTPSTPWVAYAPLIAILVTTFAGGFLTRMGIDVSAWTGDMWVLVIGAVVTLGGGAMGVINRWVASWREHQIALASAAASASATLSEGKIVEVPVQPPPAKA